MLVVADLNVHYGMHEALRSVSLSVALDEIVVILGANGAGKSTLLSAIAGICEGTVNGHIALAGESLRNLDTAQIVEHGVAFVPEGRGVFSDLSVEENLQLGSYSEHARHNEQVNLQQVLSLFPKLAERKKQIVRTMSGGEQQMVAIGRALMSAPSILMLDEPSLGLSPLLCKELFSSLKRVRDSGVGVLLVEQNAKQSLSIADRGYLLGNGSIIGEDSATNLLNDPNVQAAYLGGAIASQAAPITVAAVQQGVNGGHTLPDSSVGIPSTINVTPSVSQQHVQTVSSDSMLNENIDALVSRASSSASKHRTASANTPVQVVKLSSIPSSVGEGKPTDSVSKPVAPIAPVELPQTQDKKIQALLAEFETAAKNAATGTKNTKTEAAKKSHGRTTSEDSHPLPHIPVYKKSTVTVYRRDDAGNLRKQEES